MTIAYLAPEIPARSATFVYQEIHELQRRGISVCSFSLHRPHDPAPDQQALRDKTQYLYADGYFAVGLKAIRNMLRPGIRVSLGLRALVSDMRQLSGLRTRAKLCFQFLAAVNLADALIKNKISHVHVHFAHVPTQVAMYASAMTGVPFTVTSHANDIFERGLLLALKAERSAKFFTISDYNLTFLKGQGVPESRLGIVRCGVSLNYKRKTPNLQSDKKSLVIGSLGRLVEKKGMDILLQTLAALVSEYPELDITLRIAGDGPLKSVLQQQAKTLGIADRVLFDGALQHSQVGDWLDQLDMFVLACKIDTNGDMDGIPVVLMEAMSQSVPVVTTNLSGIPELVIPGVTGYLAEQGDVQSLQDAVGRLLANREELDEITARALQHVADEFSLESNVDRLVVEFNRSQTQGVK
ncbi:hypothetical protein LH51_03955 [Nitrincola sp. A-D6]|uniref:glycosyltransferase family 4 protein n=1 Tax=Nitrincola sp. A-D6 TaxID=1545442 RepID=UPI00051FD6EC|nr:glycosyltransferase family 4 protein [Nitrincola sp. A-D6]KGK42888.1 hypothetical protein LH51_03955 [Nitrincola sp. A-D6]